MEARRQPDRTAAASPARPSSGEHQGADGGVWRRQRGHRRRAARLQYGDQPVVRAGHQGRHTARLCGVRLRGRWHTDSRVWRHDRVRQVQQRAVRITGKQQLMSIINSAFFLYIFHFLH